MSDGTVDLGAGVRLVPQDDALLVVSDHLDLGWQEPQGRATGTAVVWQDEVFQVICRRPERAGFRWTLQPWPAAEPQRAICRLDRETVTAAAQEHRHQLEAEQRRKLLMPILPLVGLAPGKMQLRWWNEWGFPARLATVVSCLTEALLGACGLVQGFVMAFGGGDFFLPAPLRWLVLVGPLLFAEGLVRLVLLFSQGEPVGSMFLAPLALLERTQPKPQLRLAVAAPEVQRFDPELGVLELYSAELRHDWQEGGILPYRGQRFQLLGQHEEGRGWRYDFARISIDEQASAEERASNEGADEVPAPALRLLPPITECRHPFVPTDGQPGLLRIIWVSLLVSVAPRVVQERWAARLEFHPIWLTLISSLAELIGGLVNLPQDLQGSPHLLLDLFLLGEAVYRLGAVVLHRKAAGSLFGLPLTRFYERLRQARNGAASAPTRGSGNATRS